MYLTVSFMHVDGVVDGKPVTIERPVEFFLAGGQRDAGQQWMDSDLRHLSLIARSGGPLAKALENMREVTWDKGVVRSGTYTKADGTVIPRSHESEVAALAYAVQQILFARGFLTEDGRQVPTKKMVARQAAVAAVAPAPAVPQPESRTVDSHFVSGTGSKCPECGSHDVHHIDGCTKCTACGHVGSCG
jgi:ribonucleoside-diphosphate reductase alpha chain